MTSAMPLRPSSADNPHVSACRALLILRDVEADLLALLKAAVPAAHDGGEAHEHIGADESAGQQVTCRIALVLSGSVPSASIASAVGRISSSTSR